MKRDEIERLAMDSAAGELNEDAEILFKEYLAEHPEANKWARDMLGIYDKTGAAIEAKLTHTNRISAERKVVSIRPRLYVRWLPIARWAAVVIFAALIGAAAGRWSKPTVISQEQEQVTASSGLGVRRPGFNLDGLGEGFWRNKVTAMLSPSPAKINRDYIAGPSLWEKYNKYIKERHYE